MHVRFCHESQVGDSAIHLAVSQHHPMREPVACAVIRAIDELKARGYVKGGQQVAIVQSGRQPIWRSASTHAIQVSVSAMLQHCLCSDMCCCYHGCVCIRLFICHHSVYLSLSMG